ncbi:hypothetical protein HID58_068197 [Brassica napus]|uniref:Uncharacterized protein n=1 Tax=Brassica napus TaxID=3708 RepID=A0ABQ7ZKV1_BRANA|nr:hypothetical protein HID58_068197 [Brassica napus]
MRSLDVAVLLTQPTSYNQSNKGRVMTTVQLNIGIVLSKGQAPGGHTVIHGPVGESKPYSTRTTHSISPCQDLRSISSLLAMLMVKHPCDMRWLRMLGLQFLVTRHLITWPFCDCLFH